MAAAKTSVNDDLKTSLPKYYRLLSREGVRTLKDLLGLTEDALNYIADVLFRDTTKRAEFLKAVDALRDAEFKKKLDPMSATQQLPEDHAQYVKRSSEESESIRTRNEERKTNDGSSKQSSGKVAKGIAPVFKECRAQLAVPFGKKTQLTPQRERKSSSAKCRCNGCGVMHIREADVVVYGEWMYAQEQADWDPDIPDQGWYKVDLYGQKWGVNVLDCPLMHLPTDDTDDPLSVAWVWARWKVKGTLILEVSGKCRGKGCQYRKQEIRTFRYSKEAGAIHKIDFFDVETSGPQKGKLKGKCCDNPKIDMKSFILRFETGGSGQNANPEPSSGCPIL